MVYLIIKNVDSICIPFKSLRVLNDFTACFSTEENLLATINIILSLNLNLNKKSKVSIYYRKDDTIEEKYLPVIYNGNNTYIDLLVCMLKSDSLNLGGIIPLITIGITIRQLLDLDEDSLISLVQTKIAALTDKNLLGENIPDGLKPGNSLGLSSENCNYRVNNGIGYGEVRDKLLQATGKTSVDDIRIIRMVIKSRGYVRRYYA